MPSSVTGREHLITNPLSKWPDQIEIREADDRNCNQQIRPLINNAFHNAEMLPLMRIPCLSRRLQTQVLLVGRTDWCSS